MKQSVIEQMKEYRHRNNIKAIKYEEGMEDGYTCRYADDRKGNKSIFFESEEAAYKFQQSSDYPIEITPVILNEIDEEVYDEEYNFQICNNGKYYDVEELKSGSWIYIENNHIFAEEDSEYFFENYEQCITNCNNTTVNIEYDKEINQVFISNNNKSIQIDRTEVATVEKILEALEIPYTEKLGEVFLFDKEIADEDRQTMLSQLKELRGGHN